MLLLKEFREENDARNCVQKVGCQIQGNNIHLFRPQLEIVVDVLTKPMQQSSLKYFLKTLIFDLMPEQWIVRT